MASVTVDERGAMVAQVLDLDTVADRDEDAAGEHEPSNTGAVRLTIPRTGV